MIGLPIRSPLRATLEAQSISSFPRKTPFGLSRAVRPLRGCLLAVLPDPAGLWFLLSAHLLREPRVRNSENDTVSFLDSKF